MHPLLTDPRRLLWYLAAWIPVGAGLDYGWRELAAVSLAVATGLALGLTLVMAFACLSSWYTCRVLPLGRGRTGAAVSAQLAAAVLAGMVWVTLGRMGLGVAGYAPAAAWLLFPLGVLLYLLAVAGFYLWIGAERGREQERLAREAELRALKAQINPHFLFNSLNSISALTSVDPARAREMCVLLGDFFRRTLHMGGESSILLAEEIALAQAYLAIEQIRFGSRLQLETELDPAALATPVPALLLQPLVENAVRHGIAGLLAGGCIRLQAGCESGSQIRVTVENPYDPESAGPARPGVGLANVRDRLRALYGAGASLEASAREGWFRVQIRIPAEAAATGGAA